MNIFVLDLDPELCAQYHCDKHVVKMILECAQLLSTTHRSLDGRTVPMSYINDKGKLVTKEVRLLPSETVMDMGLLYKSTHVNHPCSVWLREAIGNYMYVYRLFQNLLKEYTHRYGKRHKCEQLLWPLGQPPRNYHDIRTWMTPFALAMPEHCKTDDSVESYRRYYIMEKQSMLKWTNRNPPDWVTEITTTINSSV